MDFESLVHFCRLRGERGGEVVGRVPVYRLLIPYSAKSLRCIIFLRLRLRPRKLSSPNAVWLSRFLGPRNLFPRNVQHKQIAKILLLENLALYTVYSM